MKEKKSPTRFDSEREQRGWTTTASSNSKNSSSCQTILARSA